MPREAGLVKAVVRVLEDKKCRQLVEKWHSPPVPAYFERVLTTVSSAWCLDTLQSCRGSAMGGWGDLRSLEGKRGEGPETSFPAAQETLICLLNFASES